MGTFGVALFALLETIIFVWIFKPENAWKEIQDGAQVPAPAFFLFVLKYITPLYIGFLLVAWTVQQGPAVLKMDGVSPEDAAWRWSARLLLVAIFAAMAWFVHQDKDRIEEAR